MKTLNALPVVMAVLFAACGEPTCEQPTSSTLANYLRDQGPMLKPVRGGFELESTPNAEACGALPTRGVTATLNGQAIAPYGGAIDWVDQRPSRGPFSYDTATLDDGACVCRPPRLMSAMYDPAFPDEHLPYTVELTDGVTSIRASYPALPLVLKVAAVSVSGDEARFSLQTEAGATLTRAELAKALVRIEQDGASNPRGYTVDESGVVTVATSGAGGARLVVVLGERTVTAAATECVGITCGLRSGTAARQDLEWTFR